MLVLKDGAQVFRGRLSDSIAAKITDVSEQDDDRHLHPHDANVGY